MKKRVYLLFAAVAISASVLIGKKRIGICSYEKEAWNV